jgi:predicted small integral membrane protein
MLEIIEEFPFTKSVNEGGKNARSFTRERYFFNQVLLYISYCFVWVFSFTVCVNEFFGVSRSLVHPPLGVNENERGEISSHEKVGS